MSAPPPEPLSLAGVVEASTADAWFHTRSERLSRRGLARRPWLAAPRRELAGASVLVRTTDQLSATLALIALDGAARRLVICPPDLAQEHLPTVIEDAQADAVVTEGTGAERLRWTRLADSTGGDGGKATEWVLFTSGTTGRPKLVAHTLAGLTGAIKPADALNSRPVWATFYDVRRYGGLQILLRALLGGADLVLSDPCERTDDFLGRMAAAGATHITGTPSHWRRALMSPALAQLSPRYVRLSGEIADQAVLDALGAAFPRAAIGHAYASTEAGVGFEVTDGLEGFSAAFLDRKGDVEMRVVDGSLRIRSPRCASRYLGSDAPRLQDAEAFVDTGDVIDQREGRCRFAGRRGGVINVGGLKIHPEEVEAVINRHPAVSMSLVKGRRNPIIGAVVVAEIVLADGGDEAQVKSEVLDLCRAALPPHKAPASIKVVQALAVGAGGKLERAVA